VEIGVMLLGQCAVDVGYEECHRDGTCRVDLELARIVLCPENFKTHSDYLIEECIVNLPAMYLDYAKFDEATNEFHARTLWVKYNKRNISEEEKRRILSPCNRETVNEGEVKELCNLGIINREEYIRALEKKLEIFRSFFGDFREILREYPVPFVANFVQVDRSVINSYLLFGSSDNKDWIQIYHGERFEDEVGLTYFENMREFKFYRLVFIPNKNSSEHDDCHLELYSKEPKRGEFVEGIPRLTKNNHTGYIVSSSNTKGGVTEYNGVSPYDVNQFGGAFWHSVKDPGTSCLTFQLPRNRVFNGVLVSCRASGRTDQAPRSFSVHGSCDCYSWDDLLSVETVSEWKNGEKRSFPFENNTPYLYYRFKIYASFCKPADYYHACNVTFGNFPLKHK